jgi:pilus assembly protein CpaD
MRTAPAMLICSTFLTLAACAGGPAEVARGPVLQTERYAIEVTPAPQEVKLAPHASGLSANQADALNGFVRQWMSDSGADITLKAPEHGDDPASAYRTATGARDYLVSQGVPAGRVRIVGYEAGADPHAPITVGYVRYQAKGPDCGRAWSDLSKVDSNQSYPEFGCAVTANIAVEVANPADLLAPRASDPPDAQRRQSVLDKYRAGQVTSTPKDPQADGSSDGSGGS